MPKHEVISNKKEQTFKISDNKIIDNILMLILIICGFYLLIVNGLGIEIKSYLYFFTGITFIAVGMKNLTTK